MSIVGVSKKILLRECRNEDYYLKLTKRQYRDVPGYISYKDVILDMAMYQKLKQIADSKGMNYKSFNNLDALVQNIYQNPVFPVYAIKDEILEAFMHTRVSKSVCMINKMWDNALFLLPGLLKNPDKRTLRYVFVSHFNKGELLNKFGKVAENCVRWVSVLENGAVEYTSVIKLPEFGTPEKNEVLFGEYLHGYDEDKEKSFVKRVDDLVLQIMLFIQYCKSGVELVSGTIGTGFGLPKNTDNKNNLLNPIRVGWDYKIQYRGKNSNTYNGTHASRKSSPGESSSGRLSPKMHMRSGHWRRLPKKEETIWVQPFWVNGANQK